MLMPVDVDLGDDSLPLKFQAVDRRRLDRVKAIGVRAGLPVHVSG
jgi:hypothetical protein